MTMPHTRGLRDSGSLPGWPTSRRFVAGLGAANRFVGDLYYAFPLIAVAMERELHLSRPQVYGAATFGLAVGGLLFRPTRSVPPSTAAMGEPYWPAALLLPR